MPNNRKVLYSINGEGRYTADELAKQLNIKCPVVASEYAKRRYRGVRQAAKSRWRVTFDDGREIIADRIYDLSILFSYSTTSAKALAKGIGAKIESFWEDI